jgi:hypothetical protein
MTPATTLTDIKVSNTVDFTNALLVGFPVDSTLKTTDGLLGVDKLTSEHVSDKSILTNHIHNSVFEDCDKNIIPNNNQLCIGSPNRPWATVFADKFEGIAAKLKGVSINDVFFDGTKDINIPLIANNIIGSKLPENLVESKLQQTGILNKLQYTPNIIYYDTEKVSTINIDNEQTGSIILINTVNNVSLNLTKNTESLFTIINIGNKHVIIKHFNETTILTPDDKCECMYLLPINKWIVTKISSKKYGYYTFEANTINNTTKFKLISKIESDNTNFIENNNIYFRHKSIYKLKIIDCPNVTISKFNANDVKHISLGNNEFLIDNTFATSIYCLTPLNNYMGTVAILVEKC